jgi:hypothetical protein
MLSQFELKDLSVKTAEKIISAKLGKDYFLEPYKHLVIDNFLDESLAQACLNNFPDINDSSWEFANTSDIEIKYRTNWRSEFDIPEGIIDAVKVLNGGDFLRAVSTLFEIDKLMPDPYFSGGGLNITRKGGLLDVHVDGNYHDASGLNRRMNALIYFNLDWRPEWGGEFGIYDETGSKCIKKVAPLFNRLVVFDTHDKSWHGLPDPINFPDENPRKSLLLYYYTKENRPSDQVIINEPHSALWKKKNMLDKKGHKTRKFT